MIVGPVYKIINEMKLVFKECYECEAQPTQGHLIIGNLHLESLNVKTQLVVGGRWVEIMIYKVS